jgi:hypothetical protein
LDPTRGPAPSPGLACVHDLRPPAPSEPLQDPGVGVEQAADLAEAVAPPRGPLDAERGCEAGPLRRADLHQTASATGYSHRVPVRRGPRRGRGVPTPHGPIRPIATAASAPPCWRPDAPPDAPHEFQSAPRPPPGPAGSGRERWVPVPGDHAMRVIPQMLVGRARVRERAACERGQSGPLKVHRHPRGDAGRRQTPPPPVPAVGSRRIRNRPPCQRPGQVPVHLFQPVQTPPPTPDPRRAPPEHLHPIHRPREPWRPANAAAPLTASSRPTRGTRPGSRIVRRRRSRQPRGARCPRRRPDRSRHEQGPPLPIVGRDRPQQIWMTRASTAPRSSGRAGPADSGRTGAIAPPPPAPGGRVLRHTAPDPSRSGLVCQNKPISAGFFVWYPLVCVCACRDVFTPSRSRDRTAQSARRMHEPRAWP